ncbi:LexA family protein [Zafaria sp. J156]|uniref:LexA family protein n=1 Tax=Zafaria sp. J156 TaxID=3116490 RepID=UPI002E7678E5|nr:S24 family peptidase [Zafaria sp. J156]MEE1621869.1 S24 family peptidase [Zafaria sp. J156]
MFGVDPAPRRPAPPGSAAEPTGFASPARDYFQGGIDLNRHLISDRTSTFLMRVEGSSMSGAGICDGDELIVDRSLAPRDGSVVVAVVDGELLVRRLRLGGGGPRLEAEPGPGSGPGSRPVSGHQPGPAARRPGDPVPEDFTVWGVATRCLHRL